MFEAITFRNAVGPSKQLLDIGAIAEGLLFYGKVIIAANSQTLSYLFSRIPPFIVLSLLRDKRLEIHYFDDDTLVSTNHIPNQRDKHKFIRISVPKNVLEIRAPQTFLEATAKTSQAKIGAKQFTNLLKPMSYEQYNLWSVYQTIAESKTTSDTMRLVINELVPAYTCPADFRFNIEKQRDGFFYVDTNIDFPNLNGHFQRTAPKDWTVTEGFLLTLLQSAYQCNYIAATLNSEIAVNPFERIVQASTFENIVKIYDSSQTEIRNFTDLTLTDAYAIREAVNTGKVPFSSIVDLLDTADKFRHWLHKQPVDAELIKAYYQEIVKETWTQKLSGKSLRWAVFTGLGVATDIAFTGGIATMGAQALSVFDAFVVDKIVGGWKPHQFVEGKLKPMFPPQ
ncbi:hypothetical protein PSH58_09480 [Pseudomonas hefeiensis]|uniref:Uncharacterized protein n=1 Tax=Pseudomonas hefeiensis TaxID=2738125 RepID=A0ABY9GGA4_9PSED|nr:MULTISPECIES: hypothetical protein [unclassified Pseudomonas]WLH14514.1 hypothetical protein PSH57_09475 [Pseudomonas sp. FP205]WLH97576.1 hypothetical protein PSH58_09480 [Pseudomonas sp. FP53]WLI41847.1 hypothetical protein PSH74_09465 [Pseudomonas sp. FP821]